MKITKRLEEKIAKQPKVYLVACWDRWEVREYHWTGKWFYSTNNTPQPIVYYYNDHNGEYDEYQKLPIVLTTTGICADWSFYKEMAKHLANRLNEVTFGEIIR